MRYPVFGVLAGVLVCGCSQGTGSHWPRFRGENGMAVAADHPGLAEAWSPTENVAWTAGIDGMGWSGPVVWGNKVFVTSVSSDADYERPKKGLYMGAGRREPSPGVHHWWVYCLDLNSGQVLWKHEAHRGEPVVPRHQKSTYAAETPAVDGQRVYALFGDLGLYCYDHAGKLLWSQAIEPKKTNYDYGAAASPVVHGDRVIMIYDNNEASYIAAYAAATGEELWKTTREEKSTWATPFVWENELRTEIVTAGKHRIRSYDLNGKLLWEMDGQMSNLIIPSPFAAHGMIYVTSGYVGDKHRPAYAIKPGASGDISLKGGATSNEFVRWYQPLAGPYNPSPIVYGDYYYTLYDKGFLTCHDAKTGELVYDKQRIAPGASFTSSPWAYNGKVFALSEDGDTYVFQAGPEYKLLGTNPLDELCLASPAVVGDRLLLRTASKVYCIRP